MRASQAFKEEENMTIYFLAIKDKLNYYSFTIFPQNISQHISRRVLSTEACLILHILLSLIH